MSRSGYSDDCDDDSWGWICWRGVVASTIRGKKGHDFLAELAAAMDAMPEKKLIRESLSADGCYCTLGVIGASRGMDLESIDAEDYEAVTKAFSITKPLAQEIVFMNDEAGGHNETPESRWSRMRKWVDSAVQERERARLRKEKRANTMTAPTTDKR